MKKFNKPFLLAFSFFALIVAPVYAQETSSGDVCTAGETNYVRQVGGPETSGEKRVLVCNGTNWRLISSSSYNQNRLVIQEGTNSQDLYEFSDSEVFFDTNGNGDFFFQNQNTNASFYLVPDDNDNQEAFGSYNIYTGNNRNTGLALASFSFNESDNLLRINAGNTSQAHLIINQSGNVGVNNTNPQAELDVLGDIFYSGVMRDVSDKHEKKNIKPLSGSLDQIIKLQGMSFVMINDDKNRRELGFVAQDVQKVFPNLVDVTPNGRMGLNYIGLIAPITEAIKELDAKNLALENENAELRQMIHKLNARMDVIEGKRRPTLKPYNS